MIRRGRLIKAGAIADAPAFPAGDLPPAVIATEAECLEQILEAFRDVADRDDIHQAADRLARVQEWIRRAAELAAADPIFAGIRFAS
ncbi:MAG: hypothetical protein ACREFB_13855 [Stellaceae bacterium]